MVKNSFIIDDYRESRNVLTNVFECHDCKVFEACNCKENIESYRRITDIKKEFPETKISAISGIGKGGVDFLRAAGYLGAFLNKDISEELEEEIQKCKNMVSNFKGDTY